MKEPLIQLTDVSKKFGDNPVLAGADLNIYQGEVTTIIGKSGVGKSVLLKHIIGLLEPDSGQILFQGRPLSEMTKAEKKALKKKISYMFQGTALFDSMNVVNNIALPLVEGGSLPTSEIMQRVRNKITQLDLHGIDDKYPSQLSGGMKKRVALARALVTDPEIVLFDEPTTGLDPIRKNAVHSMISEYQKKLGFTGVVVSHDIPDIFYISQRIAMLEEGRILFEGTPDDILQSTDPVVQQFIHGLESRHDDLAGIAPQAQGEKRFEQEMARLERHNMAFSLVLFTVENLNEINEILGHVAGRTVLKNFAIQIQERIRITDTCSRYGLNKIMLILPSTDYEQARQLCSKLAEALKGDEIIGVLPYPEFCFSVSAGITEAQKRIPLDQIVAQAKSNQKVFYEFTVC
ncbi:ATP-binding cassette domain-containing protein [Thermodesulfobacteriota bacterium]